MGATWEKGVLMLTLVGVLFLSPADALALTGSDIALQPSTIGQGEVALLTIKTEGKLKPQVSWGEKEIVPVLDASKGRWCAFLGADLTTVPGEYTLRTRCSNEVVARQVTVLAQDHGVRRFTVPKEMEALDAPTLERVNRESRKMREIFSRSSLQPLWRGRWIRPVQGQIISPFGCRTIINDLERSPHSGVDLRAAQGTPIKAINRGRVVLVADHFFGGLSVVIDHGGALHSMYFHLSKASVRVGQMVERGDTIGFIGSSGRATGPHLHFGIRLNGERVNPLGLIERSAGLRP